jgi:fructose-specific phosphotransferase system IIA component
MNLFDETLIELDITIDDKETLFRHLASILNKERRITNQDRFIEALKEREEVVTTGVGEGLAIPHAKDTSVLFPSLVFVRLNPPIDYQSLDNEKVNLVFCIAMPEAYHKEHLALLSKVSLALMDKDIRSALLTSKSPKEIISLLNL